MAETMAPDRQVLPLTREALANWRGEIDQSREVKRKIARWWDANLKAYAPSQSGSPVQYGDDINTNRDFTLVERKKADLFYQSPAITALPSPLFAGQEALLDTHTQILNEKLDLDGVNAKAMVHRVLFDVLCPSGMGWTILGYESATVPVPMPEAPQQPGAVLGLSGPPAQAPVPVYEEVFWRWFSPKCGLIPASARTTEFETWPWIGMEFEIPTRVAKRKGWVPQDAEGGPASKELHFDHGLGGDSGDVIRGTLLFYQSALYRDDIVHPKHQTMLILIEGQDEPAEHKDSPYQTIQNGKLSPDSLLGYPIHPCTIRALTDTAYIPSDCTISRPVVNELNHGREQMVQQRDADLLRWRYNTDTVTPDMMAKIVRAPIGGFIGMPADAMGDDAIKELPRGSFPREAIEINNYLDNDLARMHAIDAEQSGAASSGGVESATASQIKQNNVNARLGLERGVVLDWYLSGVTKYSALLQRFLPVEDAAAIVGQAAAAQWDQWRKLVPASLAFSLLPDSSLRKDLAADKQRAQADYTFFANDPFINRLEFLKEVMPKMGYSAKVINAQPPQKTQEGRHSFTFNGADLSPLAPQFAIVMDILKQDGVVISPEALQEAQTTAQTAVLADRVVASRDAGTGTPIQPADHGGKVSPMESLSRHASELTGNMQGSGEPAPMGPGGSIQ